jgi:hypothetical protein
LDAGECEKDGEVVKIVGRRGRKKAGAGLEGEEGERHGRDEAGRDVGRNV